ncbi:hypothetical protein [Paenibacillus illinoisensis]|uniref:hypothetical protein n=1 Tax=Paenibacillus illinoisensis TaxID=59845 RepID=UPI00203E5A15|nr:hypothetical protein [Paenibacillus illinoisensis]MCM3203872.1 hypothetical protein [Paenibacillus illinoisensis]
MDSSVSGGTSLYLFFTGLFGVAVAILGLIALNLGHYRSVQYQYIPENTDS